MNFFEKIMTRLSFDKKVNLVIKIIFRNQEFKSYLSICNLSLEEGKTYLNSYFCEDEIRFFNNVDDIGFNKINYLLGRISAKESISQLTKITDKKTIVIDNGIFGQPIVRCSVANILTSISHNNNYGAALAFEEKFQMGVDMENITEQKIQNIKSQLTANEIENFLFEKDQKNSVMLWTAKEALSKILKTGINCNFSLYEISKIKSRDTHIISNFVNFPQYQAASYFFKDIVISVAHPESSEFVISEINLS